MKSYIFVSYSRNDIKLINPIVRLLRLTIAGVPSVTGNSWDFVFQDIDNIEPGYDWEKQIDEAIVQAEKIFVFWCEHAGQSSQVRREYTLALAHNKVVVPILLDATPLSDTLQGISGLDLRQLNLHVKSQVPPSAKEEGKKNRWERLSGLKLSCSSNDLDRYVELVWAFASFLDIELRSVAENIRHK